MSRLVLIGLAGLLSLTMTKPSTPESNNPRANGHMQAKSPAQLLPGQVNLGATSFASACAISGGLANWTGLDGSLHVHFMRYSFPGRDAPGPGEDPW